MHIRAVLLAIGIVFMATHAAAAEEMSKDGKTESVFPETLITDTPQEGFQLAIKLSRLAVKTTQPDVEVLKHERPKYAADADSLIAVSHVVATHFQTIAEANDFWRGGQ